MKVIFSLTDIERILAPEAQKRVGASDIDGCLYKTQVVQVVVNNGSGEREYAVAVDVALPQYVAQAVVAGQDEVTGRQLAEGAPPPDYVLQPNDAIDFNTNERAAKLIHGLHTEEETQDGLSRLLGIHKKSTKQRKRGRKPASKQPARAAAKTPRTQRSAAKKGRKTTK